MRNYLNKDHKFRTQQLDLPRQGIMGDFFGTRNGEAFAASAWRNFAPLLGADKVTSTPTQGTWTRALANTGYLWAYGCGAGSFTSISGLGNSDAYYNVVTRELYNNDLKTAFALLFGSWLGDWDSPDNIMRGVLALPSYGLACAWSGRPHWFMHHMGLGYPIGYTARLTQNNGPSGLYQNQINSAAGQVHIGLMGDPTLRMHVVAPPTNLTGNLGGSSASLRWNASSDSILGYHVYRATSASGGFTRITTAPVTATTFTDSNAAGATNYMVRAVKLETSASGTHYNPSAGVMLVPAGSTTGISGETGTGGSGTSSGSGSGSTNGTNTPSGEVSKVIWVDDALPAGAVAGSEGGDSWNWVSSNPAPHSGTRATQSNLSGGLHQHFFSSATQTLQVNAGDVLFSYVYLDPANVPSEVMLQWNDGSLEHRAYWGANNISYGSAGTPGRVYMGPLPTAGQWELLQVTASQVALEGSTLNGIAFSQYDGRAAWDAAGKASGVTVGQPSGGTGPGDSGSGNTGTTDSNTNTPSPNVDATVWVDDALPSGAVPGADGGDSWNWVSSNPSPYSGSKCTVSSVGAGLHEHYFSWAAQTLPVNSGEVLFAAVYMDPANPPSELMLQWNDGSWEHQVYWGSSSIQYGTAGTPSLVHMGPLPEAGKWVLLQVPASQVGLEGSMLHGMAFSQYDGRAAWDYAGKAAGTIAGPGPGTGTN